LIARRLLEFIADQVVRSGWIGRQLHGLFKARGLTEVRVATDTYSFTRFDAANRVLQLETNTQLAIGAGVLSPAEAQAWRAEVAEADRNGRFFAAITMHTAIGRKPRT